VAKLIRMANAGRYPTTADDGFAAGCSTKATSLNCFSFELISNEENSFASAVGSRIRSLRVVPPARIQCAAK